MLSRKKTSALVGALALAGSALLLPAATAPAVAKVVELEAAWEMNEPAGASTMVDSGPNGLHTPFNPTGVATGAVYDGATAYRWVRRPPNQAPTSPERVIQVADNPNIEPLNDTFTVEIRFRTRENFGNITQKGQAKTRGGQWKIQNPQGRPSCLFKGSVGRAATRAKVAINDNNWHVMRCVRTPTSVELWMDGVRVNRKNGVTGMINNSIPMTIGGKINCNQINITCDYFSGDIDYVRIYRGS